MIIADMGVDLEQRMRDLGIDIDGMYDADDADEVDEYALP